MHADRSLRKYVLEIGERNEAEGRARSGTFGDKNTAIKIR